MANLYRLEITRYESGSGNSMRVEFVMKALYTDREPFTSARMSAQLLLDQLKNGNVPYQYARVVGMNGGVLNKENGMWFLIA